MATGSSIRGHQGQINFLQDGNPTNFVAIKKLAVNQDSTFMKSYYLGDPVPEGDQAIEGWSGNIECEVKDAGIDLFIDALCTNNLNGIGVSDYAMVSTENYADGKSQSYGYFDMQFKMSKDQAGLQEKMTKRLDFQAMQRKPL
jgi:hypothetical protein